MDGYVRGRDFSFCHLCGTMLTVPSTRGAQCPSCSTKWSIKDICGKEITHKISSEDIRRELGINIIDEQKMQLSKVMQTASLFALFTCTFFYVPVIFALLIAGFNLYNFTQARHSNV